MNSARFWPTPASFDLISTRFVRIRPNLAECLPKLDALCVIEPPSGNFVPFRPISVGVRQIWFDLGQVRTAFRQIQNWFGHIRFEFDDQVRASTIGPGGSWHNKMVAHQPECSIGMTSSWAAQLCDRRCHEFLMQQRVAYSARRPGAQPPHAAAGEVQVRGTCGAEAARRTSNS